MNLVERNGRGAGQPHQNFLYMFFIIFKKSVSLQNVVKRIKVCNKKIQVNLYIKLTSK